MRVENRTCEPRKDTQEGGITMATVSSNKSKSAVKSAIKEAANAALAGTFAGAYQAKKIKSEPVVKHVPKGINRKRQVRKGK